jgi:hypothetical protein
MLQRSTQLMHVGQASFTRGPCWLSPLNHKQAPAIPRWAAQTRGVGLLVPTILVGESPVDPKQAPAIPS